MNWCTRVVSGGRIFLRNLINLLCKLKQSNHHIRLNLAARSNIHWWANALVVFHGKTPFLNDVPVPSYYFGTDACTNGGGGHFGCDWFHVNWNLDVPELTSAHINVKELMTVFIPGKLNILADHLSRLDEINSAYQAKSLLLPSFHDVLLCKSRMSLNTFLMLQEKWMRIIVP